MIRSGLVPPDVSTSGAEYHIALLIKVIAEGPDRYVTAEIEDVIDSRGLPENVPSIAPGENAYILKRSPCAIQLNPGDEGIVIARFKPGQDPGGIRELILHPPQSSFWARSLLKPPA